ncbi:MAG: hypothetical protein JWM37_280 [Candidatus Saccharibacteria bacterium]|nr:hypothetical protein [Candidatus Saccharibacteria bacterium]
MKISRASLKSNTQKLTYTAAAFTILLAPAGYALQAKADSNDVYVTLSSFSGKPNQTITVSGGNYGKDETVNVEADSGNVAVATASATSSDNGEFSTSITLPAKLPQGGLAIKATGKSTGWNASNSYYVVPFTPTVTVNEGNTTAYGSIKVSATGFAANEAVAINFAGSTTMTTADVNGAFSDITVATPNVPAASYTVVAVGQSSGATGTTYKYVNGFFPSASPSTYYLMPLTDLAFNGSGFAPNETISVTDASSGTLLSSFKADAEGAFTDAGAFTVPASLAGSNLKVVLSGLTSGVSTSTGTAVGKYFPSISPSDYYVQPGGNLSFNGSGFVPGETVDVMQGTTKLATTTADQYGNLTMAGTVTIPATAAGKSQSYTLVGATSKGSGTVTIGVASYNAQVSPSDYYLMPGGSLSFSGFGFMPNETVDVFSGTTKVGSFQADMTGSFKKQSAYSIPFSAAGTSQSFRLVGESSQAETTATISVGQLNTQLTPGTWYALPFAKFDVTATGFAPGDTLNLKNGAATVATATTDEDGTAIFHDVAVTDPAAKSVSFVATSTTSDATASVSIAVGQYHPYLTASSYYAKPGDTVTFSGAGFAPGEDVEVGTGKKGGTVTADLDGAFSVTVELPFAEAGKNSIPVTATGQSSKAVASMNLTLAPFTVSVSPSTWYATPGTPVSFDGMGFLPGETVMVSLNHEGGAEVIADKKGNIAVPATAFSLPFGKSANFIFQGETSYATTSLDIGLAQFYASVQLDNYYGNGGSAVTASGSGFAPNEQITLTAGTTDLSTVTASAKGAFTKSFAVPYAAAGDLPITATGADSGAVAKTGYTVAQVYNSVELGTYAVPAGQALNFIGSGFLSNDTVQISTKNGVIGSFKATAQGSFNDSTVLIPAGTPGGELTLTVKGLNSFTNSTITIWVQG